MYEYTPCYAAISMEISRDIDNEHIAWRINRRMARSKAIMEFNLSEPLYDNPASKRSIGQKRRWHVWRAMKRYDASCNHD